MPSVDKIDRTMCVLEIDCHYDKMIDFSEFSFSGTLYASVDENVKDIRKIDVEFKYIEGAGFRPISPYGIYSDFRIYGEVNFEILVTYNSAYQIVYGKTIVQSTY
jgi:hypothetical protein